MRTIPTLALALAALFAATATPASAQQAYEQTIELHEFETGMHIQPTSFNVRVNEPVRFTVNNPDVNQIAHNLVVCAEPVHPEPTCADRWAFTPNIPPGGQEVITFTPDKVGTFEYFCDIANHKNSGAPALGMRGTLIVTGDEVADAETPGLELAAALAAIGIAALAFARRAR